MQNRLSLIQREGKKKKSKIGIKQATATRKRGGRGGPLAGEWTDQKEEKIQGDKMMGCFSAAGQTDSGQPKTIKEEKQKKSIESSRGGGEEGMTEEKWGASRYAMDSPSGQLLSWAMMVVASPVALRLTTAAVQTRSMRDFPSLLFCCCLRCLSVSTWWSSPSLRERERGRERGRIQEMNSERTEGEGGAGRDTEGEHGDERCLLRTGANAAADGARLKDSLPGLLQ